MVNSEWDDIPTTSELFGGDFFGDELMDMYTAIGDAPATSSALATAAAAAAPLASSEADGGDGSHPGLLIAMNAAAMDGGLSPLGSSPEQFAAEATSVELPPLKVEPAPVESPPPLAVAPVTPAATPVAAPSFAAPPVPTAVASAPPPPATTTVSAAKRPAPAAAVARNPPKKQKSPQTTTAAVPRAKVAATGGIKVSLPPGTVGATAVARPIHRAVSASSITKPGVAAPPAGVVRPPATVLAPLKKGVAASVLPKSKMPGGGINHAVVAKPSAVRSSASVGAHRIMPVAPALSAGGIPRPGMAVTRKPDLPLATPTGVIRAKSEADFKDVASAAVSSLIQNASSALARPKTVAAPGAKPGDVDVSTAHVNALTSQNWVTACNPVPAPEVPPAGSACDKAARNARRAALTQEERAKQNRDRNREHARNTRLRKKAYVEELKRTLTELVAQRDASDLERRHEAQRNREQREVRFRVMEEFLKLRGRNEPNAARWVAILEDGFAFTLPRTPFRRMVDAGKGTIGVTGTSVEQVLRGATVVMEDSQHLSAYLQTLGGSTTTMTPVQITYRCDRKRFFMDGNVAFMDFTASTLGAMAKGAPHEATLRGSARASFSPASNKLLSVDIDFDTAAFVRQVEAMGEASTAAAAVAAHEADALLDSLQMPQIYVDKKEGEAEPSATGPVSVSSDDGERSTDGSALQNA